MKKSIFMFLLQVTVIGSCLGQNDASLTYIDLIAKSNQNVTETRNQKIINWDEVPFKIDGISRITETHFMTLIDTITPADTTIIIDSNFEDAQKLYSQNYEYEYFDNNILKITIDSSLIVTYKNGVIQSQDQEGSTMLFNYYPSGQLKNLVVGDHHMLQSKRAKDSIFYSLNLIDPISKKPMQSEYIPTIKIESYKDASDCFHYKNIFLLKKMSEQPIINKEIIHCRNGNIIREVVLDRYKNYNQKQSDYEYTYDNLTLRKKTCKPDVKYSEFQNKDYKYDQFGNIEEILGATISTKFKYDERNNVISRVDYFTASKGLQKFWTRKIEYKE